MDIVQVTSTSSLVDELDEEEGEMAVRGQIQGDYNGYVPPEVVVTSDTAPKSTRTSSSKPPARGGPVRPVSSTEVPVQVRGNLQKLGKRLKGWHQRYFEVQGSHMYYYKNHTKKECLGEINLNNCYFCDATSAATFGNPFELRTTERSHIFAARNNDEMVQWVRTIRKNMGATEQEAAARKAAKPKRWESFKQALAIQPRKVSHPSTAEAAKKQPSRTKSFADKLKITRRGRSRSPSPSRVNPPAPLTQDTTSTHTEAHSTRPMSLTEKDMEQDTLEILASLQPTRSLPSTPLTTKRPVDFNESPSESPALLREGAASPALTLDSTLSTPSHSTTASPSHTADTKSQASDNDTSLEVSGVASEGSAIEIQVTPPTERKETVVAEEPSDQSLAKETEEMSTQKETAPVTTEDASKESDQREAAPITEEVSAKPDQNLEETSTTNAQVVERVEAIEQETTQAITEEELVTKEPEELVTEVVLPEILTKKCTWEDIHQVLDSCEGGETNNYNELPPEDPVWLNKSSGLEQLKAFLLTCP